MFKALRDKLKETIQKMSSRAEEEAAEEVDILVHDSKLEKAARDITTQKRAVPSPTPQKIPPSPNVDITKNGEQRPPLEEGKERRGFFSRLFKKKQSSDEPDASPELSSSEPTSASLDGVDVARDYKLDETPAPLRSVTLPEKKKRELLEAIRQEKKIKQQRSNREKKEVEVASSVVEELVQPAAEVEEEPEPKGFFSRLKEKIITKRLNAEQFEALFWDLELVLLENNVAVNVIDRIKEGLKTSLVEVPIRRGKIKETLEQELRSTLLRLFSAPPLDLISLIQEKRKKTRDPYVICFVGVNGSGKTTTVAKVAHLLKKYGLSCLLVAGDTWRAASIQQLEEHAQKLGVRLVKHDYGGDPAAVAFDGIKAAKVRGLDVVLIDTAGRQHSNKDLMREVEKIVRVAKPDTTLFVGESITGNDCILQAKSFDETVGVHGIILTKVDVDEKGGAALSMSYVTGKPIIYLGVGQGYDDLEKFDRTKILSSLGL